MMKLYNLKNKIKIQNKEIKIQSIMTQKQEMTQSTKPLLNKHGNFFESWKPTNSDVGTNLLS